MSIYPVRLAEWFPATENPDEQRLHENVVFMMRFSKCCVCGRKPRFRDAYAYHAMPWGYCTETVWCTKKCFEKK